MILLIAVLIRDIEIRGVTRWIKVGPFPFQPSELAKLSIVIFLAHSLSKRKDNIKDFKFGFLPNIIVPGIIIALIIKEPDFGTGLFVISITYILLFIGGVKILHIILSFIGLIPVIYYLTFNVNYRMNRILSFINPWTDARNTGFQLTQSLLGFGSGGFFGRGIGCGREKLFYLPDPHTDFILSVIGEELGFIGVLIVILLFLIIIIIGFRIALKSSDLFGSYLAIGITVMIGLQGLINMGVALGILPTKGIPLPFISYGGSSFTINMVAIGMLLNISSKTL
jgi:cell division protein FtsW